MAEIPFNLIIDDELYEKYHTEYETGNYTSAIKTAILYLTECIREKADLDLDGDPLITTAFSANNPLIKINNLKTISERDEQIGIMMILQGIYKSIRNPRNHNLKTDDRHTCDSILIIINYYVKLIKNAKLFFTDFLEMVNDYHFDKTVAYATEIIKTIPPEKLLDTNIKLIENINDNNFENISFILFSSIKIFNNEQILKLVDYCNNILLKIHDYAIIKTLIYAFQNNWHKLNKLSCMRIESILIKALKNLEFYYHQDTNEYGSYYTRVEINEDGILAKYLIYIPLPFRKLIPITDIHNIIKEKLLIGSDYVEYIFNHFKKFLFDKNDHLYTCYNNIIIQLLDADNKFVYNELTAGVSIDNSFDPYYHYDKVVETAIENFKTNNNDTNTFNENIPF